METFRPIPNFPGYFVSDGGVVASTRRRGSFWHIMKTWIDKDGYHLLKLSNEEGKRTKRIHHLVLETFVKNRPEGMECRHLNGDPSDNRIENLVWGTPVENAADKELHGKDTRGIKNGITKLTESQVIDIIQSKKKGIELARQYNMSKGQISRIRNGRRWKHIKDALNEQSSS